MAEDLPAQPSILIDFSASSRPVGCVVDITYADSPDEIQAGTFRQIRLFLEPDKAEELSLELRRHCSRQQLL